MMAFLAATASAAPNRPAGVLLKDLENLRVVGSVLYVAAHPDDENTRLIGYLVGERGLRTAYLSMTRGDGGQNLIGSEQEAVLGVLRTGELLAARSVDGGEQRFTRMRDFGYSKSSAETLALWGHDEALDDVVRTIRAFRPDVILTRFPTEGDTHGHHLASAILAREAFERAADPAYVTEGLAPWAADRVLYNRGRWMLAPGSDTSQWATLDTGVYEPLIGRSYGEQAAIARSMHKSQGFGDSPQVGPIPEYFEPIAGTVVVGGDDPFAGLTLDWSRFPGTGPVQRALDAAIAHFDPRAPWASLPRLAKVHAHLAQVADPHWRDLKLGQLERIMADCAGLWVAARTEQAAVAPGATLDVTLTAVSRAPTEVTLVSVAMPPQNATPGGRSGSSSTSGLRLADNVLWTEERTLSIPADAPLSRPHWLEEPAQTTRYTIPDPALRDRPEREAELVAEFVVRIADVDLRIRRPIEFAWTDPVQGERITKVEILPPVTATFPAPAQLIPLGTRTSTRITLRSTGGPATGVLRLTAPEGVQATPAEVPFSLTPEAPERAIDIVVVAQPTAQAGPLIATVEVGGTQTSFQQYVLDYPHVPRRTVLSPARQQLVPVALSRGPVARIGYVKGPGDPVPEALRGVGYQVEELDDAAVAAVDLSRFDTIITGVRAYNTRPRLLALHERLMAYVAGGGRLVVQYNTNNRFDPLNGPIGPFPFEIGRGRVTDETATVGRVDEQHPFWRTPNVLGPGDFDGWVQERGLYFASTWDPAYTPLFTMRDPDEEAQLGATLVARHGKGVFVYTGLSLWRQLPAGVPGAYRVLANLLALP